MAELIMKFFMRDRQTYIHTDRDIERITDTERNIDRFKQKQINRH